MKTYNYLTAKGWLSGQEREWLFYLASRTPDNATILNIGVEYGASLVCLAAGNPKAKIYGVDIDNSKCEYSEMAELVTMDSREFLKTWKYPINLLFIDGDHTDEGVNNDLKFADFVVPGGFLTVHDCLDPATGNIHAICPGITRSVTRWLTTNGTNWREQPPISSMRIFERKANGLAYVTYPPTNIQQAENPY